MCTRQNQEQVCGASTACLLHPCVDEFCRTEDVPKGTGCGDGRECDGAGNCVGPFPTHLWSKRFGDNYGQQANAVAADPDGNVVFAGFMAGTINFAGGPITTDGIDIFVAKLDPNGDELWAKVFPGTSGYQTASSVAIDTAGGILVTGAFSGIVDFGGGPLAGQNDDIFVAKFNGDGGHAWSQVFGQGHFDYSDGNSLAVDGVGNVIVTGLFQLTADFGGGPLTSAGGRDVFVAKLDPSGAHLWSQRYGDDDSQDRTYAAIDGAGNVLIAGALEGTMDFGGGPLVGGPAIGDVLVVKLDPTGGHVWSHQYGDAGEDQRATSVAADATGNVLFTGSGRGTIDFGGGPHTVAGGCDLFVVKLDPNGAYVWSRQLGGDGCARGQSIAVDNAGNVFVTGGFQGTVDFGGGPFTNPNGDLFILKMDSDGTHLWSRALGSIGDHSAIATDTTGNALVAGGFYQTIDFGGGPLTSAGVHDIFVAKLAP